MKNLSLTFCLVFAALFGSVASGFASDFPDCPNNNIFPWSYCFGTHINSRGDKYVGNWKNDKFDGEGTYYHINGDKYVGEFKDNVPHGQGTYYWENGNKYSGQYDNGTENGFGVFSFGGSGDRFFGTFTNGNQTAGLYLKINGRAKFFTSWRTCDGCITNNVHNVLPVLKEAFNFLDKENRRVIQSNLKKERFYNSAVDGLWGRNTLNALVEFAVIKMKTIDFNRREVSEKIINTILEGRSGLPPCSASGIKHDCFGTKSWGPKTDPERYKYVGDFKNGEFNGQGVFTNTYGVRKEGIWKDGDFQYAKKLSLPVPSVKSPTQDKVIISKIPDSPTCSGSPNSENYYLRLRWDNCFGTFIYSNGSKYTGKFMNGKMHGKGIFNFASGNKFVGEYKFDKQIKGTTTWVNGKKYVGEINGSEFHGYGILTLPDGTVKKGTWNNGKLQNDNNETAPVHVAKTPPQNDGIISASSGSGFKSDLPPCPSSGYKDNCFGTYNWKNGDNYVGEYKDDKKHGQGTYAYASGDEYVGGYRDGKVHGQGTYTFANGDKYVGDFKNAKKNGQGTFTFADGTKFVGEYKNDIRNGQFTVTYASGNKYVGEFKNDKKNGQGTYTYADGTVEEGIWKDDEFQYAKKLSPPVPTVKAPTQDDDTYKVASGSGFYVSDSGHIITNHHVIEGCEDMKVHSKGNVLETKRIAEDRRNDLALLKTTESPKHAFALSSESPFPLQDIVVAGYPFGEKVSSTLKFTQGIVSSIAGLGNDYSQIQIDAAIQPGNSGGPILDEYGNVVAVAVAKLSLKKILKDYGVVPENTNFGVKASAVRNLMEGNGVSFKSPNTEVISKRELSQVATDGTVYLTCWMTTAQIEQMRARKVLFEDLE